MFICPLISMYRFTRSRFTKWKFVNPFSIIFYLFLQLYIKCLFREIGQTCYSCRKECAEGLDCMIGKTPNFTLPPKTGCHKGTCQKKYIKFDEIS